MNRSASSAVSLDEKVVVVANLYDGLDWYSIPDRTFGRSVPFRINHNVPIPVLLIDNGKALLVGGTSGNATILDAHTAETIQTLEHDGTNALSIRMLLDTSLTRSDSTVDDFVQALVSINFAVLVQGFHCSTQAFHLAEDTGMRYIATGTSHTTSVQIWTSKPDTSTIQHGSAPAPVPVIPV